MAGTKEGARKGVITRTAKYGEDWHAKIGAKGGRNSHGSIFKEPGGREKARKYGALGGAAKKRRSK